MSSASASRRPSPMKASCTSDAAIGARAGERQAERARHGGFRIAGVRRAVVAARRGARRARRRWREAPCSAPRRRSTKARDKREAGRLTRSSSRAAAKPKASCRCGAMSDHAVGGVDRLVECGAREPADGHPENRRHDGVGKILRQAFDRRARDARGIERLRCRARRCARPPRGRRRRRPLRAQPPRRRHGGAGCVAQAACWRRALRPRCRTAGAARRIATNACERADDDEQDQNRSGASRAPRRRRCGLAIEPAVEPCDQAADPGHRMADGAMQGRRIAEAKLDQQGDEGKRDGHDRKRRRGPKTVRRRPRTQSRRRSRRRPAPFSRRA